MVPSQPPYMYMYMCIWFLQPANQNILQVHVHVIHRAANLTRTKFLPFYLKNPIFKKLILFFTVVYFPTQYLFYSNLYIQVCNLFSELNYIYIDNVIANVPRAHKPEVPPSQRKIEEAGLKKTLVFSVGSLKAL